ncbi:AAA family ATPase [Vibrio parahaemolyticus]|uniref:AAA family ATPase n=1 Tax=Vibrio parahaemolyticus TaxID=670 RepID=UPI00214ACE51|nr:AAA family ATPase [Vibrio parahaemolyticus]
MVLFDEFDALGKERDDGSEHGELRRVVNAVLQMMDSYDGKSTIIAATNHEQILDSAIWRRFDEIVEFPEIDQNQLQDLLQLKLRGVRREFDLDSSELHAIFRDKSPAIIERIIRRAVKRMILKGKEFLTIRMLRNALEQESQI